jgi:hypothetical protein
MLNRFEDDGDRRLGMLKRVRRVKVPEAPLLITESREEYESFRKVLRDEIKPRGMIEGIFVDDVAFLTWEISRLRRFQAAIINSAFHDALVDIVGGLLPAGDSPGDSYRQARDLADRWFSERSAKVDVRDLLHGFGLDISAVEAKAFIERAGELAGIEQLIGFREARRLKLLSTISQYRETFAREVRESSDQLIGASVREVEFKKRAA